LCSDFFNVGQAFLQKMHWKVKRKADDSVGALHQSLPAKSTPCGNKFALNGALLLTTFIATMLTVPGCASSPRGTLLETVGPDPNGVAQAAKDGFLRVYSALQLAPVNVEMEDSISKLEFSPEDGFMKKEVLHTTAHSGYSIYTTDGKQLKYVPNSKGMNDSNPTTVELPAGCYLVEADTEEYDSFLHPVVVPVLVKSGLITVVHLDGAWSYSSAPSGSAAVKFPNGHVIGWRASDSRCSNRRSEEKSS
jgi:hypothetical protein